MQRLLQIFNRHFIQAHVFDALWCIQKNLNFFFSKIDIKQVWLIDHYGGAVRIPVADYLNFKL